MCRNAFLPINLWSISFHGHKPGDVQEIQIAGMPLSENSHDFSHVETCDCVFFKDEDHVTNILRVSQDIYFTSRQDVTWSQTIPNHC